MFVSMTTSKGCIYLCDSEINAKVFNCETASENIVGFFLDSELLHYNHLNLLSSFFCPYWKFTRWLQTFHIYLLESKENVKTGHLVNWLLLHERLERPWRPSFFLYFTPQNIPWFLPNVLKMFPSSYPADYVRLPDCSQLWSEHAVFFPCLCLQPVDQWNRATLFQLCIVSPGCVWDKNQRPTHDSTGNL